MKKLLTIAICLTMTAFLQSQTIIRVTSTGTGNGTSWTTACNLEDAVKNAVSGTEIWVRKGTYFPSKMLVIPAFVKIYGGFDGVETNLAQRYLPATSTIIDGQQRIGSIFRLGNSAEINGFTIQNGNANGNPHNNGGGVWADDNTIIENCIISNNVASQNGGGIYANGKVTVINAVIKENSANGGGGNTFGNCFIIDNHCEMSGTSANAVVKIANGCNMNTPGWSNNLGTVSFRTDKTYTVAGKTWSDMVMADGCSKTTFNGGLEGSYNADCRASADRAIYGDLFSWCAVMRFAEVLCPYPWRVPTIADFRELNLALGGTDVPAGENVYISAAICNKLCATSGEEGQFWGGAYCDRCTETGVLAAYTGVLAYYRTSTDYDSTVAYYFFFNSTDYSIAPQRRYYNDHKGNGFALRCIR